MLPIVNIGDFDQTTYENKITTNMWMHISKHNNMHMTI